MLTRYNGALISTAVISATIAQDAINDINANLIELLA